jgi:hypothetical protein
VSIAWLSRAKERSVRKDAAPLKKDKDALPRGLRAALFLKEKKAAAEKAKKGKAGTAAAVGAPATKPKPTPGAETGAAKKSAATAASVGPKPSSGKAPGLLKAPMGFSRA